MSQLCEVAMNYALQHGDGIREILSHWLQEPKNALEVNLLPTQKSGFKPRIRKHFVYESKTFLIKFKHFFLLGTRFAAATNMRANCVSAAKFASLDAF